MIRTIARVFLFILWCGIIMQTNETMAAVLAPHLFKDTFDNGLTMLVKETPGSKVATVQIWVKAGSVYEEPQEAGITHLIEHMIFKGTPSRGPGELAEAIESVGGRINAYTSYEYTVYHATLSARHWSTALDVLTDAVLHSSFDPQELEREKKVVLEELSMRRDRPQVKLYETMMAHAYTTHPYRLPIIGSVESVSNITREDILHYIEEHYRPENLTVVVVGDVTVGQVHERVEELLAGLPASEHVQAPLPKEPEQKEPRSFLLKDDVGQSQMAMAFPIAPFDSPDTPVLDVIAYILGHGETSRLYNQLRNKKGLVYRIDAGAFTPRDPGLLEITATLDGDKATEALAAALEEVFKLKYLPVAEAELERAKRNLESEFVFNMERVEGQARVLGSFEFLAGDPREDDYLDQIRAVTREDIQRVASYYFTAAKLTAGFLVPAASELTLDSETLTPLIEQADAAARQGVPPSLVPDAYLTNVHRFTLKNGIRLLVRQDPGVPTVAMRVVFPGGLRSEMPATNGAFAFISELLPRGTERMSARELALKVATMAGDIDGFNGKNTFGLKADFLARFADEGLALLSEVVREPAFSTEEAERVRPELLSQIKQQEDSLPALAFREFNRLLFEGHPYGLNVAGSEAVIEHISAEELKKLYQQQARPDQMVLAVAGDVEPERIYQTVTTLFGDWQAPTAPTESETREEILPPDPPVKPEIYTVDRDKEQVHIIIGFLGTTLTAEDRYALETLEMALNGQSGRLFTQLRDKQSLAYSLSSFSLLGIDTGSFGVYIGTSPDKKEEAVKALWQELYRVRQELLSDAELQKAKNVLIGHYQLGLQTHSAQALEMALTETYKLGQDFGNRYIHAIEQVDAEAVRQAARTYIDPSHYVMVTVGAAPPPESATETAPEAAPEKEAPPVAAEPAPEEGAAPLDKVAE